MSVVLLVAALAAVWGRRDTLAAAWRALTTAPPATVALLFLAVLLNVALSGGVLSLLIRRYGRVGIMEMQALTAAAGLLNYLPLRAGLLGRLTWHRLVNGIPVRDSAKTIFQAIGLSAAVAAYLAGALAVGAAGGRAALWIALALPVPLLAGGGVVRRARTWCWAALFRLADVSMWALRYHAAFTLLGSPIKIEAALVLACVGVIATMVPFVSNGLGLREWAVGLAAPLLSPWHLEVGLAAELVNRAAEIIAVTAAGLCGLACLWPRLRRATRV